MLLSAPAKLNLTLDVLARRSDGYHELSTIMQTVSLCDAVEVEAARAARTHIIVKTDKTFLPENDRNTAYKAAVAILRESGVDAEVRIFIRKRIPVGAGLGGGSADAAAVLCALNEQLGIEMDAERINRVAAGVGADVPFALCGGCALAAGIGENLSPLPVFEGLHIILCKPKSSASTKSIFSRLNVSEIQEHPDTAGAAEAIRHKNLNALAFRLFNVLEPVTVAVRPAVGEVHKRMIQAGALGAAMTGTGTAVFGIFADESTAQAAFGKLKARYEHTYFVHPLTNTRYAV